MKVETQSIVGGVRWRIRDLPWGSGVTVVYSDSDDGKGQERLIGTSEVRLGKAETIGNTQSVDPENARCGVDFEALQVHQKTIPWSAEPLFVYED